MITGLSNRSLTAIVTQSLLSAAYTSNSGFPTAPNSTPKIPQEVIDKAVLFALKSLQKASIESALPTIALLRGKLSDDTLESPATKTTLAIVNLNVILNLVKSGALEDAISGFLQQAGFSKGDIVALAAALKASLTAGFVQFGITQLARIARLPGLLPQILANLPDAKIREFLLSDSAKSLRRLY